MTPGRRAWVEAMVAQLTPRVAVLREKSGRGPANVARTLAGIVSGYEAELAAAPAPPAAAIGAEIANLERSLAAIQPRPGPYGLVINGGDLMDRVRHRLTSRLAELRGEPVPAAPAPVPAPIAIELPPVPEALPFSAGPQLALFELAA